MSLWQAKSTSLLSIGSMGVVIMENQNKQTNKKKNQAVVQYHVMENLILKNRVRKL